MEHAPRVDVWLLRDPAEPENEEALVARSARLDAEERATFSSLPLPRARSEFLAGRLLLRSALAAALSVPPESLRFTRDANGKPVLTGSAAGARIRHSSSHTAGLVACAIRSEAVVEGETSLQQFLPSLSILPIDDEVCRIFGRERGRLRQQGSQSATST